MACYEKIPKYAIILFRTSMIGRLNPRGFILWLRNLGGVKAVEKKRVLLSITGYRAGDNDSDSLELITEGSYTHNGDTYTIEYEESVLSGMEGTKTIISVHGAAISMERVGSHNSHFIFEDGKIFKGNYLTPFGFVELEMFPTLMGYRFREQEGRLDLEYQLELDGVQTKNQISVAYRAT